MKIGSGELNIVCIIPAKAHSRRLPGKNLRPLAGKPLVQYSIEAALNGGISDVRVTTDSDDIKSLAARCGARPVTRPPHLQGPDASLEAVRDHAVAWAGVTPAGASGEIETAPDAVMLLLPTYPFRSAADIAHAKRLLSSGQVWEVRSADMIERCGGLLLPNSWLSAHLTVKGRRRIGVPGELVAPHCGAWIRTDRVRSIDIDTEDDWQRAERVIAAGKFNFETGAVAP